MEGWQGRVPEVLAPGGDADSVKAALLAGADAVYLGLGRFNARMRADNIDPGVLRELCLCALDRGARIYVTLNVLLAEDEVGSALDLALEAVACGARAVIVQDLGLMERLRSDCPGIEVHASTQMTTHNCDQISFLADMGVRQVNLSRELDLAEVTALCARARERGLVGEVFVHGAYCISFSGQCWFSAFQSGHSGNRGSCIQACRRRHEGVLALNLKDNNALDLAADLVRAGAGSLKIEGRRKGSDYVYALVRAWREALDGGARRKPGQVAPGIGPAPEPAEVFNRGFHAGYLMGNVEKGMFDPDGKDMSLRHVGSVLSYRADTRILEVGEEASEPIIRGDQVRVFDPEGEFVCLLRMKEARGRGVWQVEIEGLLRGRIEKGQSLWRGGRPAEGLAEAIAGLRPLARPFRVRVEGRAGEPLKAMFRPESGSEVVVCSTMPLEAAQGRALDRDTLVRQFGKTGAGPWELGDLDTSGLEGQVFLPLGGLNAMRREALEAMDAALLGDAARPLARAPLEAMVLPRRERATGLGMVVAREDWARALKAAHPQARIWCEGPGTGGLTGVWTPPVLCEAEYGACLATALGQEPGQEPVCENLGLGWRLGQEGRSWWAGPHLNACNSSAVRALGRAGAAGVMLGHELGRDQILALSAAMDADAGGPLLGVRVCGPLLAMNTRQCLVRNLAACPKTRTDADCLASCQRYAPMHNEQGDCFHVVKQRGQYNQVWFDRFLHVPEAARILKGRVDLLVLDLRDPGFLGLDLAAALAMVEHWLDLLAGRPLKSGSGNAAGLPRALEARADRGLWDTGLRE